MKDNGQTTESTRDPYPDDMSGRAPDSIDQINQRLIQYMQDGISVLNVSGAALDVNPALCKMTGFSREELIGVMPPHPYWPPEQYDHIHEALRKTLSGGVYEFELIFMRKSGERFPVIVSPFAVRNRDGEVVRYAATVKDITEHKRAEFEKNREQRVLELVARGGPLPEMLERILLVYEEIYPEYIGSVLLLDADGKRLRHGASPRLPLAYRQEIDGLEIGPRAGSCGTAAFTRKAVLVSDIASDPLWANFKGLALEHGLRSCWSVPIQGTAGQILGTLSFYHGSPRQAEPSELATIERGANLVGMAVERDHAITEMRASEAKFRGLFESAGDAILILQGDRFIDCNDRALELFGCSSREQIIGQPPFVLFPPTQPNGRESREFAIEKIQAVREGLPQFFEWTHARFDGAPFVSEVSLSVPRFGDTSIIQAIIHDITERKSMEKALRELNRDLENRVAQRTTELEKAYDELLKRNAQFRALAEKLAETENTERRRIARLLHDNYQQLLVAAKLKAEILLEDGYDPPVKDISRQLLDILDRSIEASRSLTMELAPPILHDAGFSAGMHWLARWVSENLQVETRVTGSVPSTPLPTDVSSLLFLAVRELLFNVSKHSGVRKACVDMTPLENGFLICVTDEGKGFDVATVMDMPRTFGLFNIKERLALLDGELTVCSASGSGTKVTMYVPLKAMPSSSAVKSSPDIPVMGTVHVPLSGHGRIRILVADDHAVVREGIVQILDRQKDMEIVGEAVDGVDAVEKMRSMRPDVVLMDITMPRMNGLEATRLITREIPGIKVIGLSMHDSDEMQSQMHGAGAVGYLSKNSPVEGLIAAIRNAMAKESVHL